MGLKDKIKEQLIRDEGVRLKPYVDTTGHLTIGVGRNLHNKGISQKECDYLLENDLYETRVSVLKALPWSKNLSEARQGVLLNMAFNMGIDGLLSFVNTLGYMRNGQWDKAAEGIRNSKYATQVGARAERLAKQLETDEWQ